MASSRNTKFQCGYPTPGPQCPTGQKVLDHVYFVHDDEWKQIKENETFDYIVIGSGQCGLAFVERVLTQNPKSRILMLERGGYFLPEHFQNLPFSFSHIVRGLSETFPWSLSEDTTNGKYIKYMHGMVPFFGGKSTVWSGWCPRPNAEEFYGWPKSVIETANQYFHHAENLLHVVEVGSGRSPNGHQLINNSMQPVYQNLQSNLTNLIMNNLGKVPNLTRAFAAPLAVSVTHLRGIDFKKFATPGPLLELRNKAEKSANGQVLKIVTNCIVERIYQQNSIATALKTSRGSVSIKDAKLILAMGTVPPATLLMNSFQIPNIGNHLTAHFVSSIVARIHIDQFEFKGDGDFNKLEFAAIYVAGINDDHSKQFHIQLTAIFDEDVETNARFSFQYAPDAVAAASRKQLETSKDYIVFALACLGEMDVTNPMNKITKNSKCNDGTTNILLNLTANDVDYKLWDVMDESAFSVLEKIISNSNGEKIEYWHGTRDEGGWYPERPPCDQIRVPGTIHESSTLTIGDKDREPTSSVGLDYRPHGVENVYVTGSGLWPRAGSWNPTLTMVALAQDLADKLLTK